MLSMLYNILFFLFCAVVPVLVGIYIVNRSTKEETENSADKAKTVGRFKKDFWLTIYKISGPYLHWILLNILVLWCYPTVFGRIATTTHYKAFMILVMIGYVAFMRQINIFTWINWRISELSLIGAFIICALMLFTSTGKEAVVWIDYTLAKSYNFSLAHQVEKQNKEMRAKPYRDILQEFAKITKERPLTEMESREEEFAKKVLTIIYPAEPENKTRTKSQLQKRQRFISEPYTLKPNQILDTGLYFEKGDYIRYHKYPSNKGYFWILNDNGQIKATSDYWTTKALYKGKIELKGGDIGQIIQVQIEIIPANTKPGRTSSGF